MELVNTEMYSFDAAIRGYHYYRKYWEPEVNLKLLVPWKG